MTIQIEEIDTRTAPESLLRELHEHYVGHDAELLPDDPPTPFRQRMVGWQYIPEHQDIRRWILREDDEIAAVSVTFMDRYEDLNNGFGRIHVRRESRRRGLAKQLAIPMFDVLAENNRGSLITDVPDGAEWESRLEKMGLKKSYQEKRSRLVLADLDWDMMDSWISRASERASGYELLFLSTPIDDEHLERWCSLMLVMNTAPREDLEFEDFTMSPEKWRDIEKQELKQGNQLQAYVSVHKDSGDFVGLSEIIVQKYQQDLAWQGDTGVDPEHRNKGLGRWLKAAMIKKIASDYPDVDRVDTWNAGSNEPMLNINIAMGYKPILITNAWQGDLATARKRLGV